MNTNILIIGMTLIFFLGCVQSPEPTPLACDDDVKICPGGEYLQRTPPSCEFAACPENNTNTTVSITTATSTPEPPVFPTNNPPAVPANASEPTPGICPQILQPAMGCAALQGLTPYYIEPGQTVYIDGGYTTLPPFVNEQYECRWHPSSVTASNGNPNEEWANRRSAAITIQAMPTANDAEFMLMGIARGAATPNNTYIGEEQNGTFPTKTRTHARVIGTHFIFIQQDIGNNTTALCSPAQEAAIFATFSAS